MRKDNIKKLGEIKLNKVNPTFFNKKSKKPLGKIQELITIMYLLRNTFEYIDLATFNHISINKKLISNLEKNYFNETINNIRYLNYNNNYKSYEKSGLIESNIIVSSENNSKFKLNELFIVKVLLEIFQEVNNKELKINTDTNAIKRILKEHNKKIEFPKTNKYKTRNAKIIAKKYEKELESIFLKSNGGKKPTIKEKIDTINALIPYNGSEIQLMLYEKYQFSQKEINTIKKISKEIKIFYDEATIILLEENQDIVNSTYRPEKNYLINTCKQEELNNNLQQIYIQFQNTYQKFINELLNNKENLERINIILRSEVEHSYVWNYKGSITKENNPEFVFFSIIERVLFTIGRDYWYYKIYNSQKSETLKYLIEDFEIKDSEFIIKLFLRTCAMYYWFKDSSNFDFFGNIEKNWKIINDDINESF